MKTDKKCKDTKRLVRLAIENGMTNKDIANKAGLSSKSIGQVSRWRNGESLATERQMRYLIKEFGEQLRRKSEHLLTAEQDGTPYFIKLTGDLIIKHVIRKHVESNRKPLKIAIHRLLIFRKSDEYYCVRQTRKGFDPKASRSINKDLHQQMSHCDNEDANWLTLSVPKLLSLEELLQGADAIAMELKDGRYITNHQFEYSAQELQFSLRRYLMREGIQLPDVIDISSQN